MSQSAGTGQKTMYGNPVVDRRLGADARLLEGPAPYASAIGSPSNSWRELSTSCILGDVAVPGLP